MIATSLKHALRKGGPRVFTGGDRAARSVRGGPGGSAPGPECVLSSASVEIEFLPSEPAPLHEKLH